MEVWGTMENNRLLVLAKSPGENWKDTQLVVKPEDPKIHLCSYIAFTSFTDSSGDVAEHIWITYRQRSVLVSFNAQTQEQRGILNCAKKLKIGTYVFICWNGETIKFLHHTNSDLGLVIVIT